MVLRTRLRGWKIIESCIAPRISRGMFTGHVDSRIYEILGWSAVSVKTYCGSFPQRT